MPLDWAMTQNNLGNALARLGERESGTARLEEAVAAYRAALEERTRERVPLQWATTQNNLGNALRTLGERESGTARLEEAVAAYRAALEERTRERVPLDWAMTQNNLGNALQSARRARERDGAAGGGGRGLSRGAGGTDARARAARMGDDAEQPRHCALRRSASARAARRGWRRRSRPIATRCWKSDARARAARTGRRRRTTSATRSGRSGSARAARRGWRRRSRPIATRCWKRTRERVPLDWAMTQNNLGARAPDARGARERHGAAGGGGRGLSRRAGGMDARARAAPMGDDAEQPRQRAPSAGRAGERDGAAGGGGRGLSRRRWRNGRASACRSTGRRRRTTSATRSRTLGERESGTARLEEAVAAYRAALDVFEPSDADHYARQTRSNLTRAQALLAERQR